MNEETRVDIPIALTGRYITQVTKEKGGRHYELDGAKYDSVTSLIGNTIRAFGVEKWRADWISNQLDTYNGRKLTKSLANEILTASDKELKASASIGTHMHNIIERLLKDEDVNDIPEQLEPAVQAWLKWRRQHIEWELVGNEVGIWGKHNDIYYAGQVDALFRKPKSGLGNEYMIVDWKTSSGLFDTSFLQVAAYAHALRSMKGQVHDMLDSVSAMVVRLVGDYPKDENNKKIRTAPKIFNGKVQYAQVDVLHWSSVFLHLLDVHEGKKKYVKRTTL
jgi:hypothetical protein